MCHHHLTLFFILFKANPLVIIHKKDSSHRGSSLGRCPSGRVLVLQNRVKDGIVYQLLIGVWVALCLMLNSTASKHTQQRQNLNQMWIVSFISLKRRHHYGSHTVFTFQCYCTFQNHMTDWTTGLKIMTSGDCLSVLKSLSGSSRMILFCVYNTPLFLSTFLFIKLISKEIMILQHGKHSCCISVHKTPPIPKYEIQTIPLLGPDFPIESYQAGDLKFHQSLGFS